MSETPRNPPRSPLPSREDWLEAITASHTILSDPPGVRRVQRLIGRIFFDGARYVWRHKFPLALVHFLGWAWAAASHHFTHWIP